MNKMQQQVQDFMVAMGQVVGTAPAIRDAALRTHLVEEEAAEFVQAVRENNLVESVDAICDLLYVTLGAGGAFGIDIEPFFQLVHESNMAKIDGPVDPSTGKKLKPYGWLEPDIAGLLMRMKELDRE